jgi:hypothetical protein
MTSWRMRAVKKSREWMPEEAPQQWIGKWWLLAAGGLDDRELAKELRMALV